MGLVEQATKDWQQYTSNAGEWAVTLSFISPDGNKTATINGLHTKYHLGVNSEGRAVNSKNAHIAFSEKLLVDLGYPTRDIVSGEAAMINHKVNVKDSTGIEKNYIIREQFPDETVGVIVCILGDYVD